MRIRNWTALFNEIAFIFWDTSYARDGHNMNIWLGPKEREYVRAMQDFAYSLDKDVRIVPVTVSDPHAGRAYALASQERAGVYLHHFADHTSPVKGLKVTLEAPKAAKAYWYPYGWFGTAVGDHALVTLRAPGDYVCWDGAQWVNRWARTGAQTTPEATYSVRLERRDWAERVVGRARHADRRAVTLLVGLRPTDRDRDATRVEAQVNDVERDEL